MAYPSQFSDIYNEVINKLRLDSTNDLAKVKDWVNQAYADVAVETEAFQNYATMTLTANQDIYTISTPAVRIKQMFVTPASGTESRPLESVSLEQILEWNTAGGSNTTNSGGPTHYAIFGLAANGQMNIQFYPKPSGADVITMYYVMTPTFLSSDTDTPALPEPYATECLVNGAAYKGAVFAGDPGASLFLQEYEQWKGRLRGQLRRMNGSMTRQFRLTRQGIIAPHDPSADLRVL